VGGVIVEDNVDDFAGRDVGYAIVLEKTDELLVALTLHAASDDLAFRHVERGEQGGCAMRLVVMGHRSPAALLHRQGQAGDPLAHARLANPSERTLIKGLLLSDLIHYVKAK
jgi:hypothetical protein